MDNKSKIFTVILAGGSGYRLWPLSRKNYPKQFLKIDSENSLLQDTVIRNADFTDEFILITNNEYQFTVRQQMHEIKNNQFTMFLEGVGRNTAPAIALACCFAEKDDIISIVPCDHKIINQEAYARSLQEGYELAVKGYLVTFGILPDRPETGFGYIKHLGQDVVAFKEKPDYEHALQYLHSKDYLWNSGIFMFQAGVFLEELQKYREDIFIAAKEVYDDTPTINHQKNFNEEQMRSIPADSIDYAVMEKSDRVKVITANYQWDDIGSFEAYGRYLPTDICGNTHSTNTIYQNSNNIIVVNDTPNKLLVVNEADDLVVINTVDALYISKVGQSQQIKEIISQNEEEFAGFFLDNIRSNTPWGFYEIVVREPNYLVKRMTVFPGCRTSLQKHFYKSEHWTVVQGAATVTIGNERKELVKNQGSYINIGELHRLENNTDRDVVLIEVALGEIVSEEDIQRIEDDYNRAVISE